MKQKQPHQSRYDQKEASQVSSNGEVMDAQGPAKSESGETLTTAAESETKNNAVADATNIPGVSVVRSNTPRPLSYETLQSLSGHFQRISFDDALPMPSVFPSMAPTAPPLPEELDEEEMAEPTAAAPMQNSARGSNDGATPAVAERPETPAVAEEDATVEGSRAEGQQTPAAATSETKDFVWLFEYGLEMDDTILNSPSRLAGLALRYGIGVLQGYRLVLGAQTFRGGTGSTIVAIVPAAEPTAEVWGILYRVPRRCIEADGNEPSLLDTIHAAIIPQKFFKGVEVVVRDTHREREVTSVTYVATDVAASQLHLVAANEWKKDQTFVQRLATIAREQRLPDSYIEHFVRDQLADMTTQTGEPVGDMESLEGMQSDEDMGERGIFSPERATVPMTDQASPLPETMHATHLSEMHAARFTTHSTLPTSPLGDESDVADVAARRMRLEDIQNTEPLDTLKQQTAASSETEPQTASAARRSDPWLLAFALYLVFLLLLALTFATLQGLGLMGGLFNARFLPLGVPWLVMMYGLLGGCISSIITLGRFRADCPPAFIIITWFTRPFIGSILAVLSYVLLASGVFAMSASHMPLFLLAGALAGLAEGWVFFKWR